MKYERRFFTGLTKIFDEMESSHPDVILRSVIDSSEHKCHSVVLSACSEYFHHLFSWGGLGLVEVHAGITGNETFFLTFGNIGIKLHFSNPHL